MLLLLRGLLVQRRDLGVRQLLRWGRSWGRCWSCCRRRGERHSSRSRRCGGRSCSGRGAFEAGEQVRGGGGAAHRRRRRRRVEETQQVDRRSRRRGGWCRCAGHTQLRRVPDCSCRRRGGGGRRGGSGLAVGLVLAAVLVLLLAPAVGAFLRVTEHARGLSLLQHEPLALVLVADEALHVLDGVIFGGDAVLLGHVGLPVLVYAAVPPLPHHLTKHGGVRCGHGAVRHAPTAASTSAAHAP